MLLLKWQNPDPMNTLKSFLCGCNLMLSLMLSAQDKPFPQNIPYNTKIEVSTETLEKLFHSDGQIMMQLSPSFRLTGTVENRSGKGPVITLLIKTENMQGAMLSLSRSNLSDGSVQYTGHLLKLHQPDGMLLIQKDKRYYFIRTEQRYLVAE